MILRLPVRVDREVASHHLLDLSISSEPNRGTGDISLKPLRQDARRSFQVPVHHPQAARFEKRKCFISGYMIAVFFSFRTSIYLLGYMIEVVSLFQFFHFQHYHSLRYLRFPHQIDWAQVATQLGITNGHAARMRFSRFKQAMEGVVPAPRKRTTAGSNTSSHRSSRRVKTEKAIKAEKAADAKVEPDADGETEMESKPNIDVIKTEQQQQQQQDTVTASSSSLTTAAPEERTPTTMIKPEPVDLEVEVQDTTMLEACPGQNQGMVPGQGMTMVGIGSMPKPGNGGLSNTITTVNNPVLDPALAQMSINSPGSSKFHHSSMTMPPAAPSPSGPSRHEFGPFAGSYPPPGVTLSMPMQHQHQQEPIVIDPTLPSSHQTGMIKSEPRWEV